MNRDDFNVAAAATNGRPQRLVVIEKKGGKSWRDNIQHELGKIPAGDSSKVQQTSLTSILVNSTGWKMKSFGRPTGPTQKLMLRWIQLSTYRDGWEELLAVTPQAVRTDARTMLEAADLLDRFHQTSNFWASSGNKRFRGQFTRLELRPLLEKPLSAIINGPSSTGKSYVSEQVVKLFPPEVQSFTLGP